MESKLSSALVAEFVGTFALIFIGAGAGALGTGIVAVAFAHGLVIVGFAYAYGHISGTHINPAVTVALLVAGKIDAGRAAAYIVVQLAGGTVGAFALKAAIAGTGTEGLGNTLLADGVSPAMGLMVEAILTFFLVNTVMNAAVSGKAGNFAGLAIGLTLTFAILMGGTLTGASLNPARTLGPAIASGNFSDLWVYMVGTVLGGVIAAVLYRTVFSEE